MAVCLINSFRNPANEQAVARPAGRRRAGPLRLAVLHGGAADPRVSASVDHGGQRLHPPITEPYLRGLARGLDEAGLKNRPLIMLSSGGVIGAEVAGRNPVRMIESGPAAGALAAAWFAERAGPRPADQLRHGRHHRQGLPDRGPQAAGHRQLRGRSQVSVLRGQRHAADHPLDRHDRDRGRRRQHRLRRRPWPAEGRPAERRLRARARPATAGAARCRPSPTPTWCWACWTPTISSAATCRSTSRPPSAPSTGWPPSST